MATMCGAVYVYNATNRYIFATDTRMRSAHVTARDAHILYVRR